MHLMIIMMGIANKNNEFDDTTDRPLLSLGTHPYITSEKDWAQRDIWARNFPFLYKDDPRASNDR